MANKDVTYSEAVKSAKENLDNILNLMPSMATLLVYFSVTTIKYLKGLYTKDEFLKEFGKLSDMILEAG